MNPLTSRVWFPKSQYDRAMRERTNQWIKKLASFTRKRMKLKISLKLIKRKSNTLYWSSQIMIGSYYKEYGTFIYFYLFIYRRLMASLFIYKYILHHAFTVKPPKKLKMELLLRDGPLTKRLQLTQTNNFLSSATLYNRFLWFTNETVSKIATKFQE